MRVSVREMGHFVQRGKAPESDSGVTDDNKHIAVKKRKTAGNSDSNTHDSGISDTPITSCASITHNSCSSEKNRASPT